MNCNECPKVHAELVKRLISLLFWFSVVYPFNAKVCSTLTTSDRHYRAVEKSRHLWISNNVKSINEMNSITVTLSNDVRWWMVPFEYDDGINSAQSGVRFRCWQYLTIPWAQQWMATGETVQYMVLGMGQQRGGGMGTGMSLFVPGGVIFFL